MYLAQTDILLAIVRVDLAVAIVYLTVVAADVLAVLGGVGALRAVKAHVAKDSRVACAAIELRCRAHNKRRRTFLHLELLRGQH